MNFNKAIEQLDDIRSSESRRKQIIKNTRIVSVCFAYDTCVVFYHIL